MEKDADFIVNLIITHRAPLRKIMTAHLGSYGENDLDDCLQELILRAMLNVSRLRVHENPVGWLYITASHIAKETARKNQKREISLLPLEDFENELYENDPEHEILEHVSGDLREPEETEVAAVLNMLNRREKELYRLKYIEKRSTAFIAQHYHASEGCIRMWLSRLRRHVRDIIRAKSNQKFPK